MEKKNVLASAELERLRCVTSCVVASAIEAFHMRLPNTGFTDSSIRCIFEDDRLPMIGYAATARIRSASPPMEGGRYSYERSDWWNHILSIPEPRVVVIQDVDQPAGLGAFVGEVNANILLALGCVGLVTNGAVRDLNEVQLAHFPMFAGNTSVSHAYAHIFDFGGTLKVAGIEIRPGDLIHGDRNGVLNVPLEIAATIPDVAHRILQRRRRLVDLCRSSDFSLNELRREIQEEFNHEELPRDYA